MNIKLKTLSIRNFKGIVNLNIDFTDNTSISGRNESGKSTIFDAFTFLLWGKNSEDIKDFNIKNTKDTSLNKADHEVIGFFEVDGSAVNLKKIYREKWTKKRGEPEPEFTGHETIYYFNDVPCSQGEYTSKVSDMLPESIAKLITNPFAFNSLKWEQRREVLVKIAGNVNDSDIAAGNASYESLLSLLGRKTIADFKKELGAKKKKIRETLDFIPSRIDEAERGKPASEEFDLIEKSIEFKQKNIAKIDTALSDLTEAHRQALHGVMAKQNELNALKLKLSNLENEASQGRANAIREAKNKILNLTNEKEDCVRNLNQKKRQIEQHKNRISNIEKETEMLRGKLAAINAETMAALDESETICPVCKQELPADQKETIRAAAEKNFNTNKISRKNATSLQGKANNEIVKTLQSEVKGFDANAEHYQSEIIRLETTIETAKEWLFEIENSEVISDSDEVMNLRSQIATFAIPESPTIDDAEIKQRRTQLLNEVSELKGKLSAKEQIIKADLRISELQNDERKLSQEIADLEKTEFTIEAFTKAKMDLVETRVNSMFKLVKFRMFELQINGGISEACTCLVNGVPFADANNAGKINAGLDIINTLQSHYNIFAPVWVDNAEAVNDVYPINSQLIKLIVTTDQLTIS